VVNIPFYDYKCSCGNVMEGQLRKYDEKKIPCSKCDGQAERLFPGKFIAHGCPNGHIAARRQKPNP
jgi:predicted nucleic acid-binding Zn ribbon protein